MPDRPNILVVVLDTVRADHLPPPRRDLAPHTDSLISSGRAAAVEDVHSTAPWTLPSHASMFCGAYPSEHGIHGRAAIRRDMRVATLREAIQRQGTLWLPTALRRNGYRTWAVSANPWISEPMGFGFGFDSFLAVGPAKLRPRDSAPGTRPRSSDRVPAFIRRPGARVVRHAIEWRSGIDSGGDEAVSQAIRLATGGADPFFGFVNLMEAHVPYAPPKRHNELRGITGLLAPAVSRKRRSYVNTLRYNLGEDVFSESDLDVLAALYRGEIRYADELLGRLIEGIPHDTVIVITSDHGEALGEHHLLDHQMTMIEEVLRVPFIVAGAEPGPIASLRQLPELIAEVAGVDPKPWRQRGRSPAHVAIAEYESTLAHDRRSVGFARLSGSDGSIALLGSPMAAVIDGKRKLVEVGSTRTLVDLHDEPAPPDAGSLEELSGWLDDLRAHKAPEPRTEGTSPEEAAEIEERLEQLGYL